jgi:tetratricopeptide (TPR) repeat protein
MPNAREPQKVCFVVMGFGKKTDYETGRTLDLDASYQAIIKPAVEEAGLHCIRADEVMHSGVIDRPMYDMLLNADLVIADLSTSNPNALYELGVRYALKPYATIVIKEKEGRFHFDLNHVVTMEYKHLGDDIGAREARNKTKELQEKIKAIMEAQTTDSPVFAFIPGLGRAQAAKPDVSPRTSTPGYEGTTAKADTPRNQAELIKQAEQAGHDGRHLDAANGFAAALAITPSDTYLRQQLALHTSKSEQPSELAALEKALEILAPLDPDKSNDPETLGIAGGIRKRLFAQTRKRKHLDAAIRLYGRGFDVRNDYYNGENLATCLDIRAADEQNPEDRLYDQLRAKKTRETLARILDGIRQSEDFDQRTDHKWVFATRANVAYALGDIEGGEEAEERFLAEQPVVWEIDTFEDGKKHALSVAVMASYAKSKSKR